MIFLPSTPRQLNSLYYAKIDKDSALKNTPSARIIFIGGSNLSFSLNCQAIRDSLKLNPINTAIHRGLGLIYMLDHTFKYIQKGDIIVIAPEYDQFFDDFEDGGSSDALLITSTVNGLGGLSELRIKQLLTSLKYLPAYGALKLNLSDYINYKPDSEDVYSRHSFNRFGDVIAHWRQKNKNVPPISSFGEHFNPEAINEMIEFENKSRLKGALVYFTFPSLQCSTFEKCKPQIKKVEEEVRKTDLMILGSPERYEFPDTLIFNAVYHLTKKGLDLRTNNLIADLRKVLK